MSTTDTRLAALADFVSGLQYRALPARIVEKARACLLYGASVGIAALPAAQPGLAVQAGTPPGPGRATRFLDGAACHEEEAAFANAVLFHARCQEDAHPAGHVGVVVLPAALATAEALGAPGTELIAAIVAGYEIALRIGRDHALDLSARGFRTTSAYGVFGAAAAAARLRRLGSSGVLHTLALAASMASGLREFVAAGSDEFPYQAGLAARNGMLAARLAAAGATGADTALSGAAGFFAAFGNSSGDYQVRLCDGLGRSFEMEAVACKPWPVCQFHRAVVAGVLALRERAPGGEAARIEIRMHPAEADFWGVRFTGPFHRFPQTFMSAPFCAALAWTYGTVGFAALHRFADPLVLGLVPRVHVLADGTRPRYAPHLRVLLTGGGTLTWDGTSETADYRLEWATAQRLSAVLCAEAGVAAPLAGRLAAAAASVDAEAGGQALVAAIRTAIEAAAESANGRRPASAKEDPLDRQWRKG